MYKFSHFKFFFRKEFVPKKLEMFLCFSLDFTKINISSVCKIILTHKIQTRDILKHEKNIDTAINPYPANTESD